VGVRSLLVATGFMPPVTAGERLDSLTDAVVANQRSHLVLDSLPPRVYLLEQQVHTLANQADSAARERRATLYMMCAMVPKVAPGTILPEQCGAFRHTGVP
jgi:hypothetical protein